MKKLFISCALIVGVMLIAPGTASAQSVDVDVTITVDGFVILYYYDVIDVTIDADTMASAIAGFSPLTAGFGTVGGNSITGAVSSPNVGELSVSGTPLDGGTWTTAQQLTIGNAWSVRGLANTTATVAITNYNDLAGSGPTDFISVDGAACSGSCTFIPSLASPASGDVVLDLDFDTVSNAGAFRSTSAYTITVSMP